MITGTQRNPPDGGREQVFVATDETVPFGDTECEFPTSINPLMCPDDWLKQTRFSFVKEILDPDGWDRTDWVTSWAEHITADEMERRLCESTISYNYVPGTPRAKPVLLEREVANSFISSPDADSLEKPVPDVPYPLFAEVPDPAYDIHELDPTEEFISKIGPDGKVLNPLPEGVCIPAPTPIQYMDNILDPSTPDGEALKEMLGRFKQAWSNKTSTLPFQWADDNPEWGQGLVTSILVQCFVRGIILCSVLNHGRKHYWNISKTGETFDLTRSQFVTLSIVDATVVEVGDLLANEHVSRRYITMLQNLATMTFRGLPETEDAPPSGGDCAFEFNTSVEADMWDARMAPGTKLTVEYLTGEHKPRFETFQKNLVGGWDQQ